MQTAEPRRGQGTGSDVTHSARISSGHRRHQLVSRARQGMHPRHRLKLGTLIIRLTEKAGKIFSVKMNRSDGFLYLPAFVIRDLSLIIKAVVKKCCCHICKLNH